MSKNAPIRCISEEKNSGSVAEMSMAPTQLCHWFFSEVITNSKLPWLDLDTATISKVVRKSRWSFILEKILFQPVLLNRNKKVMLMLVLLTDHLF